LLRYALTIFISAFLLFQVQPLIGKYILPWFGGGPAVWTTCMLFFQVLLLAGYAYAHVVGTRLVQRKQVVVHTLVIAAALLFLPILPSGRWKPEGGDDPIWGILVLLSVGIGLPYFILSTTSPLLQAWFSLTHLGRSPYRLYALSNAGSLLALLSYPFVVEPNLALKTQATVWSLGFGVFAVLCVYCALRTWNVSARNEQLVPEEEAGAAREAQQPPGPGARLLWLALPACGSVMLLAVTNQMCWDVAVVPFLWIVPLSLYLLSFILCFHSERWYIRPVFWALLVLSMVGMTLLLFRGVHVPIQLQVIGFSTGLFVCCMVCHGELARLKPRPRYLTSFYLMVAAGGALGGIFVTLVAPLVFSTYLELHVGMWACCALAMAAFWYQKRPHRYWTRSWWARLCLPAFVLALLVLGEALRREANRTLRGSVSLSRNFYGVLRVMAYCRDDPERFHYTLQHGRILHGTQFVSEPRRRRPITYYAAESGLGLAMLHRPRKSGLRVGVIGLGTGTIAAYGKEGDHISFYEINPEVKRLATSRFTYLAESKAKCDVVLGDARLSLERQGPQHFDVLALDAFTSDAIPVHLLTREAFEIYLRHLKPDGIIVVHTSNRYLDLLPVVDAMAEHFGLQVAVIHYYETEEDKKVEIYSCTWVLVTRNEQFLQSKAVQAAKGEEEEEEEPRRVSLWTDDYSNLFQILK